jgi:nitrate reductase cytochrome c-type subunit
MMMLKVLRCHKKDHTIHTGTVKSKHTQYMKEEKKSGNGNHYCLPKRAKLAMKAGSGI